MMYAKRFLHDNQVKNIKYVDHEGEPRQRRVDRAKFDSWINGEVALRPIADSDEVIEVVRFCDVDENVLYGIVPTPIDLKAAVHHLIEVQEIEFGSYCKKLMDTHDLLRGKGMNCVSSQRTRKGGLQSNEYAFRLDSRYECDFFARNADGSSSVIGFFQISLPTRKKTASFQKCISAVVKSQCLVASGVHSILGVSLGNPSDILRVAEGAGFSFALIRDGKQSFTEMCPRVQQS